MDSYSRLMIKDLSTTPLGPDHFTRAPNPFNEGQKKVFGSPLGGLVEGLARTRLGEKTMRISLKDYSREDGKLISKDGDGEKIGGAWAIALLILTTILVPGLIVVLGIFYRELAFAFGAERHSLIYDFFSFFGCVIPVFMNCYNCAVFVFIVTLMFDICG